MLNICMKTLREYMDILDSIAEGEVVPFRRPEAKPAAQPALPKDILHLANEWFWANDDTNTLQAVTDRGYGQGAENLVKYIQAQLQSKGWTIDFDDEIENLVLTNRQGQQVALSVNDAYDGTGWATGTLDEEQLEETTDDAVARIEELFKDRH